MNSNMVKPEQFDHFQLILHFTEPFSQLVLTIFASISLISNKSFSPENKLMFIYALWAFPKYYTTLQILHILLNVNIETPILQLLRSGNYNHSKNV